MCKLSRVQTPAAKVPKRGSVLGNREQHSQEDKSPGEREEYLRGFGDFQASVIQLLKGHGGAPADLYVAEVRTHCKSERQAETASGLGVLPVWCPPSFYAQRSDNKGAKVKETGVRRFQVNSGPHRNVCCLP